MTRALRILVPLIAVVLVGTFLESRYGLLPGQIRLQAPNTMLMDHGTGAAEPATAGPAQRPAAKADPNAARVALTTSAAAKASEGYVLAAQVSTPDGKPAAAATVTFYDVVDLLGTREMLIGSATTDGRGNASLEYLPASAGTHQIVARSTGVAKVASGEARTSLEAAVAAKAYVSETPAISRFYNVVPYGVGVVVLSVWLLIAFALLGTARGVVRGARSEEKKGVIA